MLDNLLVTLGIGALLIVLFNMALHRFSGIGATAAALIAAAAVFGLYIPVTLIHWPGADVAALHLAIYMVTAFVCGLFFTTRTRKTAANASNRKLHWGPMVIIGFFVVLVAADSVFVMLAERGLSSQWAATFLPASEGRRITSIFPGVISHDFQKKEALYNAYLLQVERQRERGWQIRKGWLGPAVAGHTAVFQVVARTRDDRALRGAIVSGRFLRPSGSRFDQDFTMDEVEPGVYRSELILPQPGEWNLVLELRKGDDLHEIRARTRIQKP